MADKVKPFEEIFPYLSYRWRYDDGEYSPYAPFTEVQFSSTSDIDDLTRFKEGFNSFMVNDADEIVITKLPKGREDVVAVDILYTESISTTIYVLKTIEIPAAERGTGNLYDIKIPRRAIGAALVNDQLNRHFDNVPLKAKAQEITANRLMYGNYLHKFDQGTAELNGDFAINTGVSLDQSKPAGRSVKTDRNYEIGVVYIDKYGRQGSLLTQKTSTGTSTGSLIKTNFTYGGPTKLTGQILNTPPQWATCYRYFVKDTSGDFNNMTSFYSYLDGTVGDDDATAAYIQFDSKDRNKITEDDFLMLRRSTLVVEEGEVVRELFRQPVLSIENEAPDTVKQQLAERKVASIGQTFNSKQAKIWNGTTLGSGASTTSIGQTVLYLHDGNNPFDLVGLNRYIQDQDGTANTLAVEVGNNPTTPITIDCTQFPERLLMKFKRAQGSNIGQGTNQETELCVVDEISLLGSTGEDRRSILKLTLDKRFTSQGTISGTNLGLSVQGIDMEQDVNNDGAPPFYNPKIVFSKIALTETALNKLKGSFFVKIPTAFTDPSTSATIRSIPIGQTTLNEDGDVDKLITFDFEISPKDDSNLDLYWESSSTFDLVDHGKVNVINWSNCIAVTGGVPKAIYKESTKILDKFNGIELVKSIRVNTPDTRFAQERRKAGIIFSGLYNSKTGINELNQFNMSLNPTKELENNYGGIQKMFALDSNLLTLTEDKAFNVQVDKDILFNADEGLNVTATSKVIGFAQAYSGNYGISTHPESFAFFGNNAYFTDAKRGNVMQLTPANGQLFPISSQGMSNFFRDRIGTADKLIGAYDGSKKMYTLSMQGYDQTSASIGSETIPNETSNITLGYSLRGKSWTSRYSFIPESGVTMNNKFYTFKNGQAYLHNSDAALRNNFYGTQYNSEVEIIFNDNPTYVSDFLTLNYEGDSGWEATQLIGDQDGVHNITNVRILDSEESGFLGWFLKEGKYHGAVVGTQPVYIIDPSGSVGADGFWPLIQDGANTQDISGTKGFFLKTRFKTSATTAKELFAISSEYYISQT